MLLPFSTSPKLCLKHTQISPPPHLQPPSSFHESTHFLLLLAWICSINPLLLSGQSNPITISWFTPSSPFLLSLLPLLRRVQKSWSCISLKVAIQLQRLDHNAYTDAPARTLRNRSDLEEIFLQMDLRLMHCIQFFPITHLQSLPCATIPLALHLTTLLVFDLFESANWNILHPYPTFITNPWSTWLSWSTSSGSLLGTLWFMHYLTPTN